MSCFIKSHLHTVLAPEDQHFEIHVQTPHTRFGIMGGRNQNFEVLMFTHYISLNAYFKNMLYLHWTWDLKRNLSKMKFSKLLNCLLLNVNWSKYNNLKQNIDNCFLMKILMAYFNNIRITKPKAKTLFYLVCISETFPYFK